MGRLDGHVALISGVARGQGRAHAVRLAEEGADIIGFDICEDIDSVAYRLATAEDLEETAALVAKTGRRMIARKADVRDASAVQTVIDGGVAELGRLDIVCANAGIISFGGAGLTAFTDSVDVLLTGVFHTVHFAKDHLVRGGRGGSIVITSSTNGLQGVAEDSPGFLGYGAAKTGLIGLMRHWALALGPDGVRVNTIHPTGVRTEMVTNAAFLQYVHDRGLGRHMHNTLPVELLAPEDVSNLVVFLCSDEGRYITGQTIAVDAGVTL